MTHAVVPATIEHEARVGRATGAAIENAQLAPSSAARGMPEPELLPALDDIVNYQRDLWERSILFWDTLRQRADNMIAHERAGKPPLLDFDYEMILDARRFDRPVNYALLRITRYGDKCLEDCLDPAKPPVMIVDPRAGHGPGIGGFKRESEVGIALHEGYPVYFVVFFPEPSPGETMADVLHTRASPQCSMATAKPVGR